jgi:serine phosphatase RsbU (regulator of sigma subunit)
MFWQLILLLLLGFFFPLFSDQLIDFSKPCEPLGIVRQCYITDSFHESYIQLKEPLPDWKQLEKFPTLHSKVFDTSKKFSYYTYFAKFDMTELLLNSHYQPAIRFGYIGEVFSIYINGHLVASDGVVENETVVYYRSLRSPFFEIPKQFLQLKDNVLIVKIGGEPKNNTMGFWYTTGYEIGSSHVFREENEDRLSLMLNFLYFFIGLYHLYLFTKRKEETHNLMFALFSIVCALYFTVRNPFINQIEINTKYVIYAEYCLVYFINALLITFLESILFGSIQKVGKALLVYSSLLVVVTLSLPYSFTESILRVWQFSAVCSVPYIGYNLFYKALKQKNQDAPKLLKGLVILIAATFIDILLPTFFKIDINLTRFAFLIFLPGIATILASRFVRLYKKNESLNKTLARKIQEVNDLNENLEQKVIERTQQLQNSLNEIRVLKEKQDGDYFLTTLLVTPLMYNTVNSSKVHIDFVVEQKMKFQFRNKLHEIGGDICVADTIQLKDKTYSVFLNGDAMGKSIQGAGGAIVLGVVFKSIVTRTKLLANVQNMFPENWMKFAFMELQEVFESFNGSMLVSVVMGLIEEDTGIMYYVNAEHPWTVLYRDENASFIEEESLYKVGVSFDFDPFAVKLFQLLDGDSIFIGSDGRDDIQLSVENGHRVINGDHLLFLEAVEESKGVLTTLVDVLKAKGLLTDDLSLLNIRYNSEQTSTHIRIPKLEDALLSGSTNMEDKLTYIVHELEELHVQSPKDINILEELVKLNKQLENFYEAAKYSRLWLELEPYNTALLYDTVKLFYNSNKFEVAIELGERLKLRDPQNLDYLILLADSYIQTSNYTRAKHLLENALGISPKNVRVLELKKYITDKVSS